MHQCKCSNRPTGQVPHLYGRCAQAAILERPRRDDRNGREDERAGEIHDGRVRQDCDGCERAPIYLKKEVTAKDLEGCDLLFIHIPSAKYTPGEVSAISKYITAGGSLFLVMDQDMWSTLEQTNVNDLIRPFGMQFGGESPDSQAGGHTNAGLITDKRLKISYHGARMVTGGTPFAFNDRSDAHPFGTFKEVASGGKIVVMGDGMVSLYMSSWEGVQDYQCQEFMQDVFRWLLK
jgi:hypothetical protein